MAEFNEIKSEIQNLTQLMEMMMRKLDNQAPQLAMQDLGSPSVIQPQEVSSSQNQQAPSIQINMLQSMSQMSIKTLRSMKKMYQLEWTRKKGQGMGA